MLTSRSQFEVLGVVALSALCAAGCGQVEPVQDDAPNRTISIYSWWVSTGEYEALDSLVTQYHAAHPRIQIQNLTGADAEQAREQLTTSIENGNPPDAYQANIGQDLMKWVNSNGSDSSESPLSPVDGWVDGTLFDPSIEQQVISGNKAWAIPVDIHRINSLFYNRDVFELLGVPLPTESMTLDDFLATCDRLLTARPQVPPLALGNQSLWELEELVFEDIFPSIAGSAHYLSYWQGKETALDSSMEATIDFALQLRKYVNTDYATLEWDGALKKMMQPKPEESAAFSAIGDWARGYFGKKGWLEPQIAAVQFPSNQGKIFVFTSDAFALPIKDSPTHELAAGFLQAFTTVDAQLEFSLNKGSIPARADVIFSSVTTPASQLRTYDAWHDKNTKKALALSGLLPNGFMKGLAAALRDSFATGDRERIKTYLTMNYPTLVEYAPKSP